MNYQVYDTGQSVFLLILYNKHQTGVSSLSREVLPTTAPSPPSHLVLTDQRDVLQGLEGVNEVLGVLRTKLLGAIPTHIERRWPIPALHRYRWVQTHLQRQRYGNLYCTESSH